MVTQQLESKNLTVRRLNGPQHPLGWALDFRLPPGLEAAEPPEARGLERDQVRLMVSYLSDNRIVHTSFRNIADYLEAGDVVVINTSGTLNAALPARGPDGEIYEAHLSTRLAAGRWTVEMRRPGPQGTQPYYSAEAGQVYRLPQGGELALLKPYAGGSTLGRPERVRLWVAGLRLPAPLDEYLERHGYPIRYSYVKDAWPGRYYQTVYATEPGSAEMPSAGRAFTPELVTRLVARGVQFAPLLLHTGVASLEDHEPPYEEYYRVPETTAAVINAAILAGRRIVAVGTTAVRALETVAGPDGQVRAGEGWTGLIITPQRGLRVVNGLLTGLHEPRATHLALIEALAGLQHLQLTYAAALTQGYLWHEFGDLHLLLP